MIVKELIELLKKCEQSKEVEYSSYSEGIAMSISGVTEEKSKVFVEEALIKRR